MTEIIYGSIFAIAGMALFWVAYGLVIFALSFWDVAEGYENPNL